MNIWLCQSNYSFLQGASWPHELVEQAAKQGYSGLAVTDFDGMYGQVQSFLGHKKLKKNMREQAQDFQTDLQAEQHPEQDFNKEQNPEAESRTFYEAKSRTFDEDELQSFYGAQVLVDFCDTPELTGVDGKPFEHHTNAPVFLQNRIAFLAPTKRAYAQICALLTYAHRNGKKALPISPFDMLAPWPTEAVAIVPARGVSQLFSPAQKHLHDRLAEGIEACRVRHGTGLFYLALTPHTTPLEKNATLNHLALHEKLGIELLATDDVFFHVPERKILHDTLTAIRLNTPLAEVEWACFPNNERTIHHSSVLLRYFSRNALRMRALENNLSLAKIMHFSLDELRYRYPSEFLPKGFTALEYLKHLVQESLLSRYAHKIPARMTQLVQKELTLIELMAFSDYFLTVWDIVRYARSQNILCQGRGSAANSAVCFLLGITAVDPMVSEVEFARFISQERGEPPDIDVDFEHERREEVIQYIYGRYGRTHAAMVANVITFRTRGALRSVGRALGFSETECTAILSVIADRQSLKVPYAQLLAQGAQATQGAQGGQGTKGTKGTKGAAFLTEKSFAFFSAEKNFEDCIEKWSLLSQMLKGFPRHLGIHSGGFVISHEPLHELCAIEPATMEGRSIVQWNKDDIEALGLFKIDILALGMLTALRKTFELLANHRRCVPGTLIPLSFHSLPPECPKTYDLICKARTTGVFQIESRAQMSMLPKVKPRSFYEIVIQIGIIRPGPIVSGIGAMYTRRRQGLEPVTYPHPKLKPVLERTLGVPVFQEQIMRIAMDVGDFSPGEADQLRRSMGAFKFTGDIARFETKLRAGMKNNGISEEFADQIYKHIEGFAQYGFPESHSTSFAHIAYASCYLKTHFPNYFLCGLLNSQPLGFYSPHSLIQEARHNNVEVLPVCVAHSTWNAQVLESGEVRLGFRMVSGICQAHADEYVRLRDALQHPTLQHVYNSCGVFFAHEKVFLAKANSFAFFNAHRRDVLWELLARPSTLFEDIEAVHFTPRTARFEAWDDMQDDLARTNTTLGDHPMALIKEIAWPYALAADKVLASKNLQTVRHKASVVVAGLVMVRQSPPTAKGMTFITIEDEFGTVNLVIRPDVYEQCREYLLRQSILCVRGQKQENGTQSTVLVKEVLPKIPLDTKNISKEAPALPGSEYNPEFYGEWH